MSATAETRVVLGLAVLLVCAGVRGAPEAMDVRLLDIDRLDLLGEEVVLRADVRVPAGAVLEDVSFFVDGVQVGSDATPPYEAAWSAIDPSREHLIRVTARTSDGLRAHDLESILPVGPVSRASVVDRLPDCVELSLTILDAHGRPVTDVRPEEVVLYENGRKQVLDALEPDHRPVLAMLLLDASGSTRSFWHALSLSSQLFSRTLRTVDRASVATFHDRIHKVAGLGSSPGDIERAMARHRARGGSTRLYDSMARVAVFLTANDADARRAVVVLTDAMDTSSSLSLRSAERYALQTGVEFHSVLVYPEEARRSSSSLRRLRRRLGRVAEATGGSSHPVELSGLEDAFLRIGEQLRSQYRVAYTSLSRRPEERARDVEIQFLRPGYYQLRYRRGHYARELGEFLASQSRRGPEDHRSFAAHTAAMIPDPAVRAAFAASLIEATEGR